MDSFNLALAIALIFHGIAVFIPERTVKVISGIAAIIAGFIALSRAL